MKKRTTALRRLILLSTILGGGAVVWQTVTGVSPLSLANALAHSIKSLTQYGKCTQSGTPTPDAPKDIACNNGSLKWDAVNHRIYTDGTPEVLTVSGTGHTQTASVPDLFSVDDYVDEAEIISGGVTHRVGIYVFDGTEYWREATHKGVFYTSANIGTIDATRPILCNAFSYSGAPNANMDNYTGKLANTQAFGGAFHFAYDEYTNDVDGFTAWLAAQYAAGTPIIVLYPLATETTEQVSAQPLQSYYGTTTVSWTAEVNGTTKTVEYAQGKQASNKVGTAKVGNAKAG